MADYYVSLMKQDTFQTVVINNTARPLVYLFQFGQNEVDFCGGWNASKAAFNNIRKTAVNNGVNNPYFVYMGSYSGVIIWLIMVLLMEQYLLC